MTTPRLTGAGTGELAMARPRAVMAVQDYHPPPAQIVMGAIPVTIGEIGWVFGHPVRGCVYVHMGLGSQVHRKGMDPHVCLLHLGGLSWAGEIFAQIPRYVGYSSC